jgi:hypothetical protein
LLINRRPVPILDFWHVLAVLANVNFVVYQFVAQRLLGIGGEVAEPRQPVDHVRSEMATC